MRDHFFQFLSLLIALTVACNAPSAESAIDTAVARVAPQAPFVAADRVSAWADIERAIIAKTDVSSSRAAIMVAVQEVSSNPQRVADEGPSVFRLSLRIPDLDPTVASDLRARILVAFLDKCKISAEPTAERSAAHGLRQLLEDWVSALRSSNSNVAILKSLELMNRQEAAGAADKLVGALVLSRKQSVVMNFVLLDGLRSLQAYGQGWQANAIDRVAASFMGRDTKEQAQFAGFISGWGGPWPDNCGVVLREAWEKSKDAGRLSILNGISVCSGTSAECSDLALSWVLDKSPQSMRSAFIGDLLMRSTPSPPVANRLVDVAFEALGDQTGKDPRLLLAAGIGMRREPLVGITLLPEILNKINEAIGSHDPFKPAAALTFGVTLLSSGGNTKDLSRLAMSAISSYFAERDPQMRDSTAQALAPLLMLERWNLDADERVAAAKMSEQGGIGKPGYLVNLLLRASGVNVPAWRVAPAEPSANQLAEAEKDPSRILNLLQDFPFWTGASEFVTGKIAGLTQEEKHFLIEEVADRTDLASFRLALHDVMAQRVSAIATTSADHVGSLRSEDDLFLVTLCSEGLGDGELVAPLLGRLSMVPLHDDTGALTWSRRLDLLARMNPNHHLLDDVTRMWEEQATRNSAAKFKIWLLTLRRQRDPGPFPAAAYRWLATDSGYLATVEQMRRMGKQLLPYLPNLRDPIAALPVPNGSIGIPLAGAVAHIAEEPAK